MSTLNKKKINGIIVIMINYKPVSEFCHSFWRADMCLILCYLRENWKLVGFLNIKF